MENKQVRRTRSGKLLGSVVTKKVVRETVEVVVTPFRSSEADSNNNNNNQVQVEELQVISTWSKENENVEVISSTCTTGKSPLRKVNIVFGKETEDQVMKETPPEERRKKEQWRKEEHDNEIEKQQTRDYIQDSENQQIVDQPEKNMMDMEDEDETQPASEADVPPPPPLEKEMLQEDDEEWFDVENEPKEPSPPGPELTPAEEDKEEERMETPEEEGESPKKAKRAEEENGQELHTPPRYEAPQKKEELKTDKKRKTASLGTRKGGGGGKKRSRRRRVGRDIAADYKTYIYRVLKQVHPDLGISSKGMSIINSFLNEMYEKIADEAGKLSRYTGRKTLSVREIQDSVKMVLPGDLGVHAMAEGAKAVALYATYTHEG